MARVPEAVRSSAGYRRLGWAGAVILAGAVLAGVREPAGRSAEGADSPGAAGALPADLDLVPRDAIAFISAGVANFVKSPVGEEFLKNLAEDEPEALKALERALGIPPTDLERVTVVVAAPEPGGVWLIFVTTRPYTRDKVVAALAPGAAEKKGEGVSYFQGADAEGPALRFVSDRVFLWNPGGAREPFRAPAAGKKQGPLDAALRLATQKHHAVAAVYPPQALVGQLKQGLPPDLAPFKALLETRSATVVLDIARNFQLNLSLTFPDRDAATAGAKAVRVGVQVGRENLTRLLKALAQMDEPGMAKMLQFLKQVEPALKTIQVKQEGTLVRFPFEIKTDAGVVSGAMSESVIKVREAAQRMQSQNNLKQLALAMHNYEAVYQKLPPPAIYSKDGKPLLSWRVAVLPFIEQDNLYKQFKLDEPWDSEHNKKLLDKMPDTLRAPSGTAVTPAGSTHYQVFVGPGAAFESKQGQRITDFTDGTSNTLLIVEAAEAVPWTKPADLTYDPKKPLPKLGGLFKHGFNAVLADASARFIKKGIDEKTLRALITRNGGELIGDF
jgi:hypothetical protein